MSKSKASAGLVTYVVFAVITIVLGILFCASAASADTVLSIVMGVILMLSGLAGLVSRIAAKQTIATMEGVINAFLFALGLLFVIERGGVAGIIFTFFPFVLMCIGGVLLLDALLMTVQRKEKNTVKLVFELVLGVVALVLGICLRFVDKFPIKASLILGIMLIALGTLQLLSAFAYTAKE